MAKGLRPGETPLHGPRPFSAALTVLLTLALAAGLPLAVSESAAAGDVSLTLYANLVGWSTTPGNEDNPGPTIVVTEGDHVFVTLTSEDGLEHGLWIDYNGDNVPNGGDFLSPRTTSTVNFDLIADVTGQYEYFDQGVPINHGSWVTNSLNHAPTAAIRDPTAPTSWTAGVAHDIVFDVSDSDGDGLEVVLTYSYNGGAGQGPIAGPIPAGSNPNTVSWTPTGFEAIDTVVHVTAQDARGLSGSADSAPFEVDSSAPVITGRSPARDATAVDLGSSVTLTWSEPMNAASGGSATFGVRAAGGVWLSGSIAWSPDATRMTFEPATALSPASSYEVHVNGTARDDSNPGNAIAAPDVWTFSTGSTTDQTPPTILAATVNPARQVPGGSVNLTADVTDNAGVTGVSVSALINGPSSSENLTMLHESGSRWYLDRTYGVAGHYAVVIWATDSSGNAVSQTSAFDIASGGNASLPAPASVTVTVTDGVAEISWSAIASPGLVGYHVYRREEAGPFARLTVAPFPASMPTVYRDGSAEPDRTYVYTVTAVDTAGSESPYGPESTVTIPPYQTPPIFDPIPWAVAGITLAVILGALYGTIWRRRTA